MKKEYTAFGILHPDNERLLEYSIRPFQFESKYVVVSNLFANAGPVYRDDWKPKWTMLRKNGYKAVKLVIRKAA